jgi:hypothetical protein
VALVAGWDLRGAIFSLCFVLPYLFAATLFRLAASESTAAAAYKRRDGVRLQARSTRAA